MANGENKRMGNGERRTGKKAVQSYRGLEVWQRGRSLVRAVYELSASLPESEKFGLVNQMRRAAVSIPANIAEGWARHYSAEFVQFIRHANGSLAELETHLFLSQDLKFTSAKQVDPLLQETQILGRQLLALERSLNNRRQT